MKNKRKEILHIGLEMVSQRGYEWLSFQKISDNVGITKSSIYHYFKKKEDLGLAILELIEEIELERIKEVLVYESETEKLMNYLMKGDSEKTLHLEAMAKLSFDFKGLSLNIQKKIKEISINNYNFILIILQEGVRKKEFTIEKDLEEAARGIILMNTGNYIYNRIFGDTEIDINKYILETLIH